jgi:hypothetical protein
MVSNWFLCGDDRHRETGQANWKAEYLRVGSFYSFLAVSTCHSSVWMETDNAGDRNGCSNLGIQIFVLDQVTLISHLIL